MKDKQTKEFYEFSSFKLDAEKRRLLYEDEIVPLTPKEFEVLFLLIENAGQVVEKDELLDTIWKDTFVEEGTLTRNVSWLRKKLAAHDEDGAKIIETLPKRGYRFLPEIRKTEENLFIVEEQIVQQIQIEESIEIIPSPGENEISLVDDRILETQKLKKLQDAPTGRKISAVWILPALLIFIATTFFAYQEYFSKNRSGVIIASKIVPFSGLPGREDSPAFSPDGNQMVFSWDGGTESGNSNIYVKVIGAGDPLRLTADAADDINPVFSPDGKSIAFVRVFRNHNEIILMSALGGSEQIIYDQASYGSVSFSPDGKSLAIVELGASGEKLGIYLINLQSKAKIRLTAPDLPAVDHTPRFSPDGKNLAFIRYFSPFHREIFVIPAEGGEPRQITFDDVRVYGIVWSSDNQKLFFTSYRNVNRLNLWQVAADGGEPQLIETGSRDLGSLAISPNGRTIAFVEEKTDENIWQIAPEAVPRPIIRSTHADHSEQFSPDGRQIAFASDRSGSDEIWIADADGKNQRQLTDSTANAGSPRFSPDGKYIAYDAQTPDGSDVYIIPANGGAARQLTETGKVNSLPAWSIDGKWIFFRSNRTGSYQIWKLPAEGGDAVQITQKGAFEMFAAPDGKKIIYTKGSETAGFWQVNTDGGGEAPIPELAEAGGWRSWAITPSGVYYTGFAAQPPFPIKLFDFATHQTKEVTATEKSPLTYFSNLAVSSDDKKILYARQDQSASSIMLAELN